MEGGEAKKGVGKLEARRAPGETCLRRVKRGTHSNVLALRAIDDLTFHARLSWTIVLVFTCGQYSHNA